MDIEACENADLLHNIPTHVIEALLTVAYDYMQEDDFNKLLDTDWTSPEIATGAWQAINSCLQTISKSQFPGPKETIMQIQQVLSCYKLIFDGEKIIPLEKIESSGLVV